MHYDRWRYHGDPTAGGPPRIIGDDEARFWSKVDKDGPGGCWLWTAGKSSEGYGKFKMPGSPVLAHRFAYELLIGLIPDGLELDHVHARGCRHRHCVNPAHLEAVTHDENVRRSRCAS